MGLGDFFDYETKINRAIDTALDKNLVKVNSTVDDIEQRSHKLLESAQQRLNEEIDESLKKVEERGHTLLDNVQERLRAASETFFSDLEHRWERRLEIETRAQFKLLNRVLLYTFVVAIVSFGYALARTKLGW